jgi:hypothetical protein
MKNIILMFIVLGLVSCESMDISPAFESNEMESQIRSATIVDIGPDTPNPDNPDELCIGCGCQADFNSCMGVDCQGCEAFCGPCVGENHNPDICRDIRKACHKCDSGLICFRFTIFNHEVLSLTQLDSIENGKTHFTLDELTSQQVELLSPYVSTIESWQEGTTLTNQDYDILDSKIDDFN